MEYSHPLYVFENTKYEANPFGVRLVLIWITLNTERPTILFISCFIKSRWILKNTFHCRYLAWVKVAKITTECINVVVEFCFPQLSILSIWHNRDLSKGFLFWGMCFQGSNQIKSNWMYSWVGHHSAEAELTNFWSAFKLFTRQFSRNPAHHYRE